MQEDIFGVPLRRGWLIIANDERFIYVEGGAALKDVFCVHSKPHACLML